ncbi:MAG: LPXTG cell wall anchor domain-containing protein, partial [Clostridia bacterium]|nr:LPXTG cell wall anchor domain-containing protein [Clostridia bacterium]
TDSIFAGWYTADGLFVYHGLAVTSDLVASAHFVPAPAAHGAIRFPQADQTVSVALGERATLSVEAENAVAYQWYADLKDNLSWRKVSGTQAAYTTDAATQASSGDQYMCVVTFADGSYATAPLFTLQVGAAVSIPQTGDSASLALWMGLAAASFIGLAALSRKAKKSC